jgi:ribosomal-protein-alanine N-acetyltransferase
MSAIVRTAQPGNERAQGFVQGFVRAMCEADIDAITQIENAIYPFPWTDGNFRDSLKAGYDAWVFEVDSAAIAYAFVMWLPDEVHLLNLSVAAAFQRRGIARSLLGWMIEDTRERGAGSMMLEVRPSNEPAKRLYEAFGFDQIGLRRRYYPSAGDTREDALVLRLVYGNG